MKRQIKNYKLKRIYPFIFWKKCCKCQQEFKKEYGWKISLKVYEIYLCNECARTESEVEDIMDNNVLAEQIIIPRGGNSRMIKSIDELYPSVPPMRIIKK